ncbi:hypothetical protein MMC12_006809 [Toensbergia leucococca]|nr:hypothetical protein [Toensbergia leucococca]
MELQTQRLLPADQTDHDAFIAAQMQVFDDLKSPDLEFGYTALTETCLSKPSTSRASSPSPSFDSLLLEKTAVPPLPETPFASKCQKFRYLVFTVYRRLFCIVFFANFAAFAIILIRHRTLTAVVNAAAANLMVSGLARSPYVVNAMLLALCSVPRTAPLCLRRRAAKISHYGGIHSGCGVAALIWYFAFVGLASRDYALSQPPQIRSAQVVVIMYLILFLLTIMIIAAHPTFRFKKHDIFELTHRFSGWLLVVLFWTLLLVLANDMRKAEMMSLGHFLVIFPSFWFAVVIAMSLILPWAMLRKVSVEPEYLSDHAIRLRFDYTQAHFGQGIGVSTHPLKDWHSFAAIPGSDGKTFSCLVSKAGDWTSACIKNQPTRLWKRAVPIYGFGYTAALFRRILIVATGSGIGPILAFLTSDKVPPTRVLWQTKAPQKTYGDDILNAVLKLDEDALIIDTDKHGRQDMMGIAWNLVKDFDAEAVFVVSRPNVVRDLVFGFEARGIPAYGPLFDS